MKKQIRVHLTSSQKSKLDPTAGRTETEAPAPSEKTPLPQPSTDVGGFGGDLSGSGKSRPTVANRLP